MHEDLKNIILLLLLIAVCFMLGRLYWDTFTGGFVAMFTSSALSYVLLGE